jgi:two-component system, cell cycle sensor histidine kinase and response regulator CckA
MYSQEREWPAHLIPRYRIIGEVLGGALLRTRAEEAVRTSRERLRLLFEQAPLAVIEWDTSFRVASWNRSAERIFGTAANDAVGKRAVGLICTREQEENLARTFKSLLARTGGERVTTSGVSREGRPVVCEWYNTPLVDSTDRVVGATSVGVDVTERRHVEEERERLREQMAQARKMQAVGQLAGGIAHDFNNLLQIILGHASLAAGDATTEGSESLAEIRQAAERATALVRQLLLFSRRQQPSKEVVDLNDVLSGILKMLRRLIGEHVVLEFRPTVPLRPVRASVGELEQIVINLCTNARDAMPDGGTITVSTAPLRLDPREAALPLGAGGGGWVELRVQDTGVGIPPELHDRIFEPFFTTKEVGKGTGLGLATVYAIVEQHGGTIRLQSEPGRGTTMAVLLPASERRPQETDCEPAGEPTRSNGGGRTILYAEDDPQVRGMALQILSRAGYRVIAAEDGTRALELFGEHADHIDLALMDVIMPGRKGTAVMDDIRARRPALPVILCSGYSADVLDAARLAHMGVDLVQKPFRPRELLGLIESRLCGRGA